MYSCSFSVFCNRTGEQDQPKTDLDLDISEKQNLWLKPQIPKHVRCSLYLNRLLCSVYVWVCHYLHLLIDPPQEVGYVAIDAWDGQVTSKPPACVPNQPPQRILFCHQGTPSVSLGKRVNFTVWDYSIHSVLTVGSAHSWRCTNFMPCHCRGSSGHSITKTTFKPEETVLSMVVLLDQYLFHNRLNTLIWVHEILPMSPLCLHKNG